MEGCHIRWWAPAARGAIAVTFGLAVVCLPVSTMAILVTYFGAFGLLNGAIAVAWPVDSTGRRLAWPVLAQGAVVVAAGVSRLLWSAGTPAGLVWLMAAWSLLAGWLEVALAIRLRGFTPSAWIFGAIGLASLALAVALALQPELDAMLLARLVGSYALVSGALLIAAALTGRDAAARLGAPRHTT